MWEKIKLYVPKILEYTVLILLIYWFFITPMFWSSKTSDKLKDFKDGIQNHLVWSISGQCYFVRPNDEVTVYLIKVPDCDRSK
jgi:hypothetical protein